MNNSLSKTGKRVLITGGTGLLGLSIQRLAPTDAPCCSIYFPGRDLPTPLPFPALAANITDYEQMRSVFNWANPEVVVHTAAIGSVDYAECNRGETRGINVGGTEVVADLCRIFNARLVYISSNAVFDGRTPLYDENAPVSPINYYGQLKVEAEDVVRKSGAPWLIVRPILMYGWPYPGERENPVVWWVRSLESRKRINVVDNVFSKPLPVWSCAEAIWALINKECGGIYHVAGRDHLSLYEFALLTAEIFALDADLIEPVPDSFFPEIAPRPKDTSFDTKKIETELGLKTVSAREGLLRMRQERTSL